MIYDIKRILLLLFLYNIAPNNLSMSDNHEQFNIDDAIKALPLEEKVSVVALKKLLDQR